MEWYWWALVIYLVSISLWVIWVETKKNDIALDDLILVIIVTLVVLPLSFMPKIIRNIFNKVVIRKRE